MRAYDFSPVEWERLEKVAAAADELSDSATNTRRWNPQHNLVGIVGEATFARVAGLPFFPERRIRDGLRDGGEDFAGVDVKAVVRSPPLLMRLRSDPLKAPFYALVLVDLERRSGRYEGYATREMLDEADDREFGHGPTRTLEVPDLRPGFPPVGRWSFYAPISDADLALLDRIGDEVFRVAA